METCCLYKMAILMVLVTLYTIQVQTSEYNEPIISGSEAAQGQFPWLVVLKRDESDKLLCGGSIISDSWVLTAAHCTYGKSSILLVFGTIELSNMDIKMTSNTFFNHPEYDDNGFNNDIALIQLPTALNFSDSVKAIPLVTSAEAKHDFVGAQATIMGFGQTSDQSTDISNVLLWAQVQIISNSKCIEVFTEELVKDTTMCAKGEKEPNTSICKGDSGGPLVWKNEADIFVQIGVSDFTSMNKCAENFPSAYARVSLYLGFIQNITGLALD